MPHSYHSSTFMFLHYMQHTLHGLKCDLYYIDMKNTDQNTFQPKNVLILLLIRTKNGMLLFFVPLFSLHKEPISLYILLIICFLGSRLKDKYHPTNLVTVIERWALLICIFEEWKKRIYDWIDPWTIIYGSVVFLSLMSPIFLSFFFFLRLLETIVLLSKLFSCLLFFFCLKDCCDSGTYISGGMSMLGLLQKSFCLSYRMEL